MADFTSAEIQAFKKMNYDEKMAYFKEHRVNLFALDLETIVASDIAEATTSDSASGATVEEKLENSNLSHIHKNSYKNNKSLQNKTEEFIHDIESETVKDVDTSEATTNSNFVESKKMYSNRYQQSIFLTCGTYTINYLWGKSPLNFFSCHMLSYFLSQSDGNVYLLDALQLYSMMSFLIDFEPSILSSSSALPFQHLYVTDSEKVLSASRFPRRHIAIESCSRASLISPFTNISNPITASIIVRYRLYISFHDLHLLIFQYLTIPCPFAFLKTRCLPYLKPLIRYVHLIYPWSCKDLQSS